MMRTYVAHGLVVHSAFALAGMTPDCDERLPSLALELTTGTMLQGLWSGSADDPLWRGRLGDGSDLVVERGSGGDLLFTHGESARHRLDPLGLTLHCAPQEEGLGWQRALLTKIIPVISLLRGYEALHASAVSSPRGTVVIAAPSGIGKSTLAGELTRRGWPLMSDDVLTLEQVPEGVRAHPGTPHMNLESTSLAEDELDSNDLGSLLAVFAGERWVTVERIARKPALVSAICLLERGPECSLQARALSANPLPLSPYMLGLPSDTARERRRFELYASLMSSARLVRVSCGPGDGPTAVAELIEGFVLDAPSTATMVCVR
jgi:hypothetical protein